MDGFALGLLHERDVLLPQPGAKGRRCGALKGLGQPGKARHDHGATLRGTTQGLGEPEEQARVATRLEGSRTEHQPAEGISCLHVIHGLEELEAELEGFFGIIG